MNKDNINTSNNVNDNLNTINISEELDVPFTEAGIEKQVKTLKNNKAVGSDNIRNEYFLTGKATLIPVLCKLFNNILISDNFHGLWVKCVIIPVFKKGAVNHEGNYRGISLASHVGKLFTCLINSRLLKWCERNDI